MVHDWPFEPDERLPSPQLVAAWLLLDSLPTERVPLWAAHWIAGGYDGPALAELAGLRGDDPCDVRALLGPALRECGVVEPDVGAAERERETAAAMTAFTAVAELWAEGRASEHWVVQKVCEIVEPHFAESVTSLPLGHLYYLDDEWGAGWGRTDDQLRVVVQQACRDQLGAASRPESGGATEEISVSGSSAGESRRRWWRIRR